MVAVAYTVAFDGIDARLVEVQCAVTPGMPAFNIVGLPDKAVSEARERVRTALSSLSIALPSKRITVNLSPADLPKETLLAEGFTDAQIESATVMRPVGCDKCNKGYKGRVGIYEVVRITPELQRIIMEGGNSLQIAEEAGKLGFNNLRISGLRKAAAGMTSLEEVNRVTKD